jgi:hypothetical protein
MRKTLLTILVIISSLLLLNCTTPKENKTLSKSDISPGTAIITGTITEIEPISDDANDSGPCSKAPCIALVKVSSAEYGASFPQLVMGKDIRVKFLFTLEKTTKEMFPNMEEEYPGLEVGQEFTAVVAHILSADETAPKFQINGYESN